MATPAVLNQTPTDEQPAPSVLVVGDPADLLRKVATTVLAAGLVVIGATPDANTAVRYGHHHTIDLLVVVAPLIGGLIRTIQQLADRKLGRRIVVMSRDAEPAGDDLLAAVTAGADGWLTTELTPGAMSESLNAVLRGEAGISRRDVARLISELRRQREPEVRLGDGTVVPLTPHEHEILIALAGGASTKQLSAQFEVTEGTVRWHTARLAKKLNVTSRDELSALVAADHSAGSAGWVDPLAAAASGAAGRSERDPDRMAVQPPAPGTVQLNQGWATLAPAELRIVRLVARAMTNREIAAQLFLSKHTVDSHLKRAFSKLNVRSRVELTRLLLAHEANRDLERAALTG